MPSKADHYWVLTKELKDETTDQIIRMFATELEIMERKQEKKGIIDRARTRAEIYFEHSNMNDPFSKTYYIKELAEIREFNDNN